MPLFQTSFFFWRTVNSKQPTIPFRIVACTFSDNLSLNSCKLQFRWTLGFGYLSIISNVDKNWSRPVTAIMDKSPQTHLHLWVFLSIHTYPTPSPPPPPQPHKQCWTSASEFQHCIGGGRENCKKISERMPCFIRASINFRKLRILQWHVPRTFVHNFRGF